MKDKIIVHNIKEITDIDPIFAELVFINLFSLIVVIMEKDL